MCQSENLQPKHCLCYKIRNSTELGHYDSGETIYLGHVSRSTSFEAGGLNQISILVWK